MITEHQAIVNGRDLPVSTKHVVEIAKFIKGKSMEKSKMLLQRVIDKKQPVPFTRFKRNVGHKPGRIAAGRYPEKASREVLLLLNSLEANASNKGLETKALYLTTIIPNRASEPWHPGRQGRRKMKRTHLTIIAEERIAENVTQQKKESKEAKK